MKKIAILGLSHGYQFAKQAKRINNVELVAVAGKGDLAIERATTLDVPLFHDYKQLLNEVDIDGVIIALPTQLHLEAVKLCAKKQIDVLVEKPIASTVQEGKQMIKIAREADIQLLVGHHRRFSSKVTYLKDLLTKETIGNLIGITMFFTLAKDLDYFKIPWRISPTSGGPILINVAHDIDTIRYVTGLTINRVYAVANNNIRNNDVEDTASIMLETKEGVVLNYLITDGVPAPWSYEFTTGENPKYPHYENENCYFFFGQNGSLAFPTLKKYSYKQNEYGWDYPLEETQFDKLNNDPIKTELHHFISVLKRKTSPLISGEDALETLKVILAIKKSIKNKSIVEVNTIN